MMRTLWCREMETLFGIGVRKDSEPWLKPRDEKIDQRCFQPRATCKLKPHDLSFFVSLTVSGLSVIQSSISFHSAKRMMLGRSTCWRLPAEPFRFALG